MVSHLKNNHGHGVLIKSDNSLNRAAQRAKVVAGHLTASMVSSPVNGSVNPSLIELFAVKIPKDSSVESQRGLCFEAVVLACHQQQWDKINKVRDLLIGFRDEHGRSLFKALIEREGRVVIKSALENGLYQILADGDFQEALHHAVYLGRWDLLPILGKYISVNQKDSQGRTPLHVAISAGQSEIVRALLKMGADPTIRLVSTTEGYAFTAFSWAVARGEIACFDILTSSSKISWTEAVDRLGNFLQVAIQFGQIDMLLHLLTHYYGKIFPLIKEIANAQNSYCNFIVEHIFEMGHFYFEEKQHEKAIIKIEQAIKIWKIIAGENNSDIGVFLLLLGRCYFRQKKYGNAEIELRNALKLNKSNFGESHPFVAYNLGYIGMYDMVHERYKDAITNFEKTLKIFKEADFPREEMAFFLFHLGACYLAEGKYEEARIKLDEVTKSSGENMSHIKTKTYNLLGLCYARLENLQQAQENYQQAYLLAKKVLGENHADTQQYKNNMLNPKKNIDWKKFMKEVLWAFISR